MKELIGYVSERILDDDDALDSLIDLIEEEEAAASDELFDYYMNFEV